MSQSKQKVLQHLAEAHSAELALVRVLEAQIAVTPQSSYRTTLERHLHETREHAGRVQTRMRELGASGGSPFGVVPRVAKAVGAQLLAVVKAPVTLFRGSGGEEQVLKNAKAAYATEALEIATYTALEQLARKSGDERTAKLAADIRVEEERMRERVLREFPNLTDAVFRAERAAKPATARKPATTATGKTRERAKQTARKAPAAAKPASQDALPIARYDAATAEEIVGRLPELSQIDLAAIAAYERAHDGRATILDRVGTLRGAEPWSGYDALTVAELQRALAGAGDERRDTVRTYERAHRNRAGVLDAIEAELAKSSS